MPLQASNYV